MPEERRAKMLGLFPDWPALGSDDGYRILGMCYSTRLRSSSAIAVVLISCITFVACGSPTVQAGGGSDPSGELSAALAASPAAPFFRDPLLSNPKLSPDGSRIAALLSKGGTEVLISRPTLGGELQPIVKLERTFNKASYAVNSITWAGNERLLVGVQRPHLLATGVRARQTRLMSVALEGGKPKYLGENWRYEQYTGAQDRIIDSLPEEPNFVVIGLWSPDENGVSARRLNVINGALFTTVRARYGTTGWAADHQGVVRAGWGEPRSGTEVFTLARISEDHPWEELIRWDQFSGNGFWFAAFGEVPEKIYVYRNTQRNRLGLYHYDLEKRKVGKRVFSHREYDIAGIRTANDDGRLLSVYYHAERPMIEFMDEQAKAEGLGFVRAMPGLIPRIIHSDTDENYSIIQASSDVTPPRYFLYDRRAKELLPLFSAYPDLEEKSFSRMEPIEYQARDGLTIHGYLTLPQRAEAPHPTIVLPHGGPWARDTWGWNSEVQYLASLGFAVFQPNFRGSDGYGEEFERRGWGEWGLSMQDDITDGTRWLIDEGIADAERIGIYGGSYGGYAALWGLVKEPELYRAGASFAGVTDLTVLLADDARYYSLVEEMEKLVGDRWSDRDRLIETSPARNASKIQVPVFIAHGTEDWRVHVKQAESMADALEAAGVPVELHLYRGEVHGFIDERNRIDFYTKLGAFFQRHLMSDVAKVGSAEAAQAE